MERVSESSAMFLTQQNSTVPKKKKSFLVVLTERDRSFWILVGWISIFGDRVK